MLEKELSKWTHLQTIVGCYAHGKKSDVPALPDVYVSLAFCLAKDTDRRVSILEHIRRVARTATREGEAMPDVIGNECSEVARSGCVRGIRDDR